MDLPNLECPNGHGLFSIEQEPDGTWGLIVCSQCGEGLFFKDSWSLKIAAIDALLVKGAHIVKIKPSPAWLRKQT